MKTSAVQDILVKKRDGRVVPLDPARIYEAMAKAFHADMGLEKEEALSDTLQKQLAEINQEIVSVLLDGETAQDSVEVERIQDMVEMRLMKHGHYRVARRYIVYREEHARQRALRIDTPETVERPRLHVRLEDGSLIVLDESRIYHQVAEACRGLEELCDVQELVTAVERQVYNAITPSEIARAMVLSARSRIERDPAYDTVASRLMLAIIYREALGRAATEESLQSLYEERFENYIQEGIEAKRLTPKLGEFDIALLAKSLKSSRDAKFPYLGLQTIYDRYLLHVEGRRIEAPQYFWMRVAMGLAIEEGEQKNQRALEFYDLLSSMRFTSATPTLFNSGTCHPQLSSCYLTTVLDDLEHIFKSISDNAKLSKWAGGLGNDWTSVRATNSHIKGTNGQSQGVIPFLKVVNDAALAVNQGGKRKGAVCSYLETWHLDVEEFLDLRKNTGDERRRTHDMHTANWIPDLFMKRVEEKGEWTLFSPDEVPDLHDLCGAEFEERYTHYEKLADEGKLDQYSRISALDLWRKMLSRLFETGHPWITWKDPSNVRSTQSHVGVIHSSNLCTEILLNTSREETAVCNLGSVNLPEHIIDGQLNLEALEGTIQTAIRMLDNVIGINFYPIPEASEANHRHRPVGLGVMGFQDALLKMRIGYASQDAVNFADRSMEAISYYAILSSSQLAAERGTYSSYQGSKWDQGLLPIDTIDLLEKSRGQKVDLDRSSSLPWQKVRESIAEHGMRNSNVMAIAPTATISTIVGVSQSIEPSYKHLFVKSNLSGEFTQVNSRLVEELKERDLWGPDTLEALKHFDGSLLEIPGMPEDLKERYRTAFEIEPKWLIECAARRQKWIDMGQSLNLYMAEASGRKLNDMYFLAWKKGLKTTYYLRSLAATTVEKSTVDVNRFGIQPRWMKSQSSSSDIQVQRGASCNLDGTCEACE